MLRHIDECVLENILRVLNIPAHAETEPMDGGGERQEDGLQGLAVPFARPSDRFDDVGGGGNSQCASYIARNRPIREPANPFDELRALTQTGEQACGPSAVLLPCNVVLYEKEDGKVVVGAVDPMQTLGAAATGSELVELAGEVAVRLERILAELPA